jgi:hypothetical protein
MRSAWPLLLLLMLSVSHGANEAQEPILLGAEGMGGGLASIDAIEAEAERHAEDALMESNPNTASATGGAAQAGGSGGSSGGPSSVEVAAARKSCETSLPNKVQTATIAQNKDATCLVSLGQAAGAEAKEEARANAASLGRDTSMNRLKASYEAEKRANGALQAGRQKGYMAGRNCRIQKRQVEATGKAEASRLQEKAKLLSSQHATALVTAVEKARQEGNQLAAAEEEKVTTAKSQAHAAVSAAQLEASSSERILQDQEVATINGRIEAFKAASQAELDKTRQETKTAIDQALAQKVEEVQKAQAVENEAQTAAMELTFRLRKAEANAARDTAAFQALEREGQAYREEVKKALLVHHTALQYAQAAP